MGVGLVPFYQSDDVPKEALYDGDGKGLAQQFDALCEIAKEAGLRTLRDFNQNEFDDPESADWADLIYHPISEGITAVEGLIARVRSAPEAAAKLDDRHILGELEELARSLREAQRHTSRFCLFFM